MEVQYMMCNMSKTVPSSVDINEMIFSSFTIFTNCRKYKIAVGIPHDSGNVIYPGKMVFILKWGPESNLSEHPTEEICNFDDATAVRFSIHHVDSAMLCVVKLLFELELITHRTPNKMATPF